MATKVGERVTLSCAGDTLNWVEHISNPVNAKTITSKSNIRNTSRHGLNTDDGKNDLIIKSTQLADGGRYTCKDLWNDIYKAEAEVIVFGKTCFQFNFDLYQLSVYLSYKPKWHMIWSEVKSFNIFSGMRQSSKMKPCESASIGDTSDFRFEAIVDEIMHFRSPSCAHFDP